MNKSVFFGDKKLLKGVVSILIILFFIFVFALVFSLSIDRQGQNKGAQTEKWDKSGVLVPSGNSTTQTESNLEIESSSNLEVDRLLEKVFAHIFLPSGDVKIETIVKPEELRKLNPVFYQFASVGDNILIYADRAILYNPTADKVIDVYHFNLLNN